MALHWHYTTAMPRLRSQVTITLEPRQIERLRHVAAITGEPASRIVGRLIDAEHERVSSVAAAIELVLDALQPLAGESCSASDDLAPCGQCAACRARAAIRAIERDIVGALKTP